MSMSAHYTYHRHMPPPMHFFDDDNGVVPSFSLSCLDLSIIIIRELNSSSTTHGYCRLYVFIYKTIYQHIDICKWTKMTIKKEKEIYDLQISLCQRLVNVDCIFVKNHMYCSASIDRRLGYQNHILSNNFFYIKNISQVTKSVVPRQKCMPNKCIGSYLKIDILTQIHHHHHI